MAVKLYHGDIVYTPSAEFMKTAILQWIVEKSRGFIR